MKRLPEPNLDELSSVLYLALVVRLVSDPASECRAAAAAAVSALLSRVSGGVFHQLLEFTGQWFGRADDQEDARSSKLEGMRSDGGGREEGGRQQDLALRRTAAQASGIFVQARPDLVRKGTGKRLPWLLSVLTSMLPQRASDVITAARNAGWGDAAGGGDNGLVPCSTSAAGSDSVGDWEGVYHAVISIGKAFGALPGACNAALSATGKGYEISNSDAAETGKVGGGVGAQRGKTRESSSELFDRLLEAVLYPHAWVRLAAARVWGSFFAERHPGTLSPGGGAIGDLADANYQTAKAKGKDQGAGSGDGGREFLQTRRVLFRLCKNFCAQLNRSQVDPKLMDQCVKNLVFLGRAMHLNPELCFDDEIEGDEEEEPFDEPSRDLSHGSGEEEEEEAEGDAGSDEERHRDGPSGETSEDRSGKSSRTDDSSAAAPSSPATASASKADPLRWVFNRMSHMVVHKGEARRRAVFSWFGAMVSVHEPEVAAAHLRLMLLPLRRAVLDAEAGGVEPKPGGNVHAGGEGGDDPAKEQTSAELATEVCLCFVFLIRIGLGTGIGLVSWSLPRCIPPC